MSKKPKLSFSCDEELIQIIDSIGVGLSHSSRSETIIYLLKKAIYLETEGVTASYVQVFLKEELDKLAHTVAEQVEFALDERHIDDIERVGYLAHRSNILSLANLILISNQIGYTEAESNDVRTEAVREAMRLEEE